MYKIIFFDLDGTLLNDDKKVLEENKKAIEIAKQNGIEVVICSGRQKEFVKAYKEEASSGKYIICANGAEIYDCENKDEIFSCELDKNLCFELYNIANEKDYLIRIDTPYARYINKKEYLRFGEIELTEDINRLIVENKIIQISIVAKEEEINNIDNFMKNKPFAKIENRFKVKYFNEDLVVINIVNSSVSKGNAISGLCRYLKINIEDSVAFGDDLNDMSMFKTVGTPIAMENAIPVVKEIAKKVIGHNNRPSIAECIYEMIKENNNA